MKFWTTNLRILHLNIRLMIHSSVPVIWYSRTGAEGTRYPSYFEQRVRRSRKNICTHPIIPEAYWYLAILKPFLSHASSWYSIFSQNFIETRRKTRPAMHEWDSFPSSPLTILPQLTVHILLFFELHESIPFRLAAVPVHYQFHLEKCGRRRFF